MLSIIYSSQDRDLLPLGLYTEAARFRVYGPHQTEGFGLYRLLAYLSVSK